MSGFERSLSLLLLGSRIAWLLLLAGTASQLIGYLLFHQPVWVVGTAFWRQLNATSYGLGVRGRGPADCCRLPSLGSKTHADGEALSLAPM
jgi:hypothetical protein